MRTLCNIVLILAAAAAISPAAHGQYTTPVTVTSASCTDSNGDPCGSYNFNNVFYDVYATITGTCADSSVPPQVTYAIATATVYDLGGCGPGNASTAMQVVPDADMGIDATDAKASLTIYTLMGAAEQEQDCEGNYLIDSPSAEICP